MSPDSLIRTVLLDLGDEAAARDRVGVVGADAQRISQVAKRLERDAVGRPALEPVGTVGDQEMAALLVERRERGPAPARLLGADQRLQRIRPIAVALERLDQRRPAARSSAPSGRDRATRRRGAAPRPARTPPSRARPPPPSARADARAACSRAARRPRPAPASSGAIAIDLDDEQLAHEIDVADAERLRGGVGSRRRARDEMPAHGCGRGLDERIVVRVARVAARAPAIGEHVGIEEIGDAGLACRRGTPSPARDRSASAWRSCPARPAASGRSRARAAPRRRNGDLGGCDRDGCAGARRSTIGSARMERPTKV